MEIFTDPRDGKTYKIVKIGNLLWFAENLRYQGVEHYFPDRNSDNVEKYGCLYTWDNATKACPDSWHLPSKEEFDQLLTATEADSDSSSIRDPSWESGSNSSGFGVLPAGYKYYSGSIYSFGLRALFWSATPHGYGNDYAYYLGVVPGSAYVYNFDVNYTFSVRYVKEI